MEGVLFGSAKSGRVSKWFYDLQLLDHRSRPPVRDDDRQCVFVLGAGVDKMNIEPIDIGYEIRERLDARLARAPVVLFSPVFRQRLGGRELNALRLVVDRFLLRPAGSRNPAAKFY